MAEAYDAVVFDLGGVLIDWDPRYLYRQLFDDEAEMEHFLATVCTPAWNLEQDRGRLIADAVALLQREHPHEAERVAAFYERWPEMLAGPIDRTVHILEELHAKGVRLFALTNWSAETFPYALERFGFLALFEDIIVSGRERLVKPDAAIFELLLAKHTLPASRALFIDDSTRNVAGARAVGMDGIVYQGPDALRIELEARGLLEPARETPA